jgi:hypothetical protein
VQLWLHNDNDVYFSDILLVVANDSILPFLSPKIPMISAQTFYLFFKDLSEILRGHLNLLRGALKGD